MNEASPNHGGDRPPPGKADSPSRRSAGGIGPPGLSLLLGLVAAAEAVALLYKPIERRLLPREESVIARGLRVAQASGCFACHSSEGARRPNPGSSHGDVPDFASLNAYDGVEGQLADYVRDGAPRRLRDSPEFQKAHRQQLLQMPAYGQKLSPEDISAVVAYIEAVAGILAPRSGTPESRGYALALANNCFGCHGPLGAGGVGNLGSLKGYVPGLWGRDFLELVRNDDELRSWIRSGTLQRYEENPLAHYFLHNQAIHMPSFGSRLTDQELSDLVALIRWLQMQATPQ